ncbi:MAG: PLP-dependent transferase [Nitrospinae bacterium]|nr:PLP-dependent transferase [Nitrospinota bacterium]
MTKRLLSPNRADEPHYSDLENVIREQLEYFGIQKGTEVFDQIIPLLRNIYKAEDHIDHIWSFATDYLLYAKHKDKIALFNANKFICFQLAKLLDNLQNPLRKEFRELRANDSTQYAKGPYSMIDNIPAIFSSQPVIVKTATYIYSCIDWIRDSFQGKEFLQSIYSRLLNPTSISLANYIVELECGYEADRYMALNFNSGMSAIDATLSHLLGYGDILILNKNIYGGSHQLIYDWFGKNSNLDIAIEAFSGVEEPDFKACFRATRKKYADRLKSGKNIYVFIESPCNPHGYVLDVPGICRTSHQNQVTVILDSTVATPFLIKPLKHPAEIERPDFLIHSYTKDLQGHGTTTGGCVIGKNERIFIPKGEKVQIKDFPGKDLNEIGWENTMFWNVYYIKGAFLDSEKAFDVIEGIKTLEHRMLAKCINTVILHDYFKSNKLINVKSSLCQKDLLAKITYLALPAPLMTLDIPVKDIQRFKSFVDSLSPMFGGMVSLGQTDTIISCPALTTHSELSQEFLKEADITPTTLRIAVGMEDVLDLIFHFKNSAELFIDPEINNFSKGFMSDEEVVNLRKETYLNIHERYIASKKSPFSQ